MVAGRNIEGSGKAPVFPTVATKPPAKKVWLDSEVQDRSLPATL